MNSREIQGVIFNIQRFCITDGDGIRTTVFLKGCPLHCRWCHNPESQLAAPQLMYKPARCVGCMACADVCKHGVHRFDGGVHFVDFSRCIRCGLCTAVCCYDALELCGSRQTAGSVIDSVCKDKPFFGERGGMTVSGGEPLMQPEFLEALLRLAAEAGIRSYIETSGFANADVLARISPLTDCFLFDWKLTDPALHKTYIGVDNSLILHNLRYLAGQHKRIVLRCPIIPGVNACTAHFEGIARLASSLDAIDHVELMAYHTMGESKKGQLGRADSFRAEIPEQEQKQQWLSQLRALGCDASLG